MKVDVIKKYFQSWLDNDVEIVKQTFSENALYSECYGPEYHGLSQIVTWFENWNNKGQVLEWTIKRIFEQNQTLIVEWYFRCKSAPAASRKSAESRAGMKLNTSSSFAGIKPIFL